MDDEIAVAVAEGTKSDGEWKRRVIEESSH
jgi:hypothetical protein